MITGHQSLSKSPGGARRDVHRLVEDLTLAPSRISLGLDEQLAGESAGAMFPRVSGEISKLGFFEFFFFSEERARVEEEKRKIKNKERKEIGRGLAVVF